jgi:thiamine biosynthesis lipoprotein
MTLKNIRTFFAKGMPGLMLLLWGLAGCASPAPLRRFEFSRPQMGVPFRIVLYASDTNTAHAAAEAAFARVSALNDKLSDYEYDSELSRLSRSSGSGTNVPVSPELWLVLSRAQDLAARTDGAFDVTVGPFVSLWRKARREKRLPDPERLAEARAAVGYRHLVLDPKHRTALLRQPFMRLDLGAIAKGYAADEALKTLRLRGVRRAMVAAAGDIAAGDPPPGKTGWRIAIAALDVTNAPPERHVLIRNCGLSTSGDLFQHLEIDGVRYSHIVDPRTGLGLTDHSLITVIARDDITADSLDTAVSVLGPERGLKLVEQTGGAALHLVRKPGGQIEEATSKRFTGWLEKP